MPDKTIKNSRAGLIRAFINRTKADSVFFVPGAHDGRYCVNDLLYRQAELALSTGDTKRALAGFSAYLKKTNGRKAGPFQIFTAAAITGRFSRAFGALADLDVGDLNTAQKIEIANPWYRVRDKALLARLLAALEQYSPRNRVFNFHRLAYLFILKSANGLAGKTSLRSILAGFGAESPGVFIRRIWLYFKIAETALNLCHFAEAEKIFSRILAEEPDNEQAAGRLAEALLCSGKNGSAFAVLRKAAKYHKVSMTVWEGELLLWLGRYKEAEKKLRAGSLGGHQLAWCWLGAALFKLGKRAEAVRVLEKALGSRPEDNEARIWLSEALSAGGRVEEARAQLRTALKANPTDFWCRLNLAALSSSGGDGGRVPEDLVLPGGTARRLAVKSGLPKKLRYDIGEIKLMAAKARELAEGVRRDENYLREFWLG